MASRYWVGGSAAWDSSTANWSDTSGGASGFSIPGPADDVFFDAASGAVTVTWTASSPTVNTINCTGFTGTHATGGNNKTLDGLTPWTSPVTCTITGAPTLTVSNTGATLFTVTCNHASPSSTNAPNFNFTGGTYTLLLSGTGFNAIDFTGYSGNCQNAFSMYGNLTLSTGGTFNVLSPTWRGSSTVISNGKTIRSPTINGVGITVTLADAMTTEATRTFVLTAGTLNLAGFTLTCGAFSSSNSNTRSISFGAGSIALIHTSAGTTILVASFLTGFSWTGTGGFTRNQAVTASIGWGTLSGGNSIRAINFTVTAGASQLTINSGSYINNLIFTGSTCTVTSSNVNIAGNLTLATGGTYTSLVTTFVDISTVTSSGKTIGNTTINADTVTLADAMTLGIANTLTFNAGTLNLANFTLSCGIFSSNYSDDRAIAFGSGNIALTSTTAATTVLSMATATGFTWTGTGGFTRNMAATATMVFGTTGGTVSNAPNLTVNAGASTLAITSGSYFKNLDFTGSTCMVTATSLNMAGNLTFASGGSYLTVQQTFLATATITSVGKQINNTTINGSGITVTLADAMTLGSANTLTLTQGTFTAANFNVTVGSFSSSNSNTRTLNMGSGTWTMLGNGATVWDTATTTGLTVVPSTSTITMTNASAKTFAGGGLTYYNLNQGGAGALTISGSNTFNDITNTTQPSTVTFTAGTTQTVSNFSLAGTAGNLVTINSDTPGSQFTLSKSSGTVNAQYLSIQDSNATGGATWNSLTSSGNVDAGNNSGWFFSGGTTFNSSISESSSATDVTQVLALVLGSQVQETATATDTILVVASTFGLQVSETSSATDVTLVAASIFGPQALETTIATDAVLIAASIFGPQALETTTATDATSIAASIFGSQVQETATATDTTQSAVIFMGTIVETATATDLASSLAQFVVQISENANITDVTLVAPSVFGPQVQEAAAALDLVSAFGTFRAQFVDSATVSDAVVSAFLWNLIVDIQDPNWGVIPTPQVPVWVTISDDQSANWVTISNSQAVVWSNVSDSQNPNWQNINNL